MILHASSPLGILSCNRSRGYNAGFITTHRNVTVYRVLQMRGGGYADVLPVLQVPDLPAGRQATKQMQCPVNAYVELKGVWREFIYS
ncbi:MAG: hypothetical protein U9N19_04795 [Thermodesulfobacteriota bacterium]|nr:hypothetical protein [Thermodesulfobacteriota bacterium]